MQRVKSFVPILVVIIISSLFYTGCDSDDTNPAGVNSNLVGTWTLTGVELSYMGQTESYTAAEMGMSITVTLNADGTMTGMDGTDSISGTWSTSGNTITMIDSSGESDGPENATYSLSGNTLRISFEETEEGMTFTMTMIFTRQ